VGDPREDRVGDDCDEGGEAPCMAHLLDEDGRLDPPPAIADDPTPPADDDPSR
jgi:hypothetical protein